MADRSGQTVIRAEQRTASSILYGMNCFASEAMDVAMEQHRLHSEAVASGNIEEARHHESPPTITLKQTTSCSNYDQGPKDLQTKSTIHRSS